MRSAATESRARSAHRTTARGRREHEPAGPYYNASSAVRPGAAGGVRTLPQTDSELIPDGRTAVATDDA